MLELVGAPETRAVLADMKASAARAVMRPAIRAGCRVIAKEAKQRAPGDKRHRIRRLIDVMVKTTSKGNVIGRVYVKESKADTITLDGREVPFNVVANILEFGSPEIPAQSFMRKSRRVKGAAALRKVSTIADRNITRQWELANRKHKTIWT
jgi:HK97 gp10 family phage protein